MADTTLIEFQNVSFSYHDTKGALNGVNLSIERGEKVAIIGPNGAGKSTLLLHFNAILKGSGIVLIDHLANTDGNAMLIRRKVGFVFQDPNDQLFCPTVFDDVAFGPLNFGTRCECINQVVSSALSQVDLCGYENKSAHHLSSGERKRVAIASVLACEPEILVFDEPTANLDPKRRRELIDMIRALNKTVVIATHDLDLALDTCSRSIIMNNGRIVCDGSSTDILNNESLLKSNDLELPLRSLRS